LSCLHLFRSNPKGAKQFRDEAIAALHLEYPTYLGRTEQEWKNREERHHAREQWQTLTPTQKRASRLERRTEIEQSMESPLRALIPDIEAEFPILNFFVDFASPKLNLAIEIDGPIHKQRSRYDFDRERKIRDEGWEVHRFSHATLQDIPTALKQLRPWTLTRSRGIA
jgi:very-short-patch-repair endonuclease